VDTFYIKFFSEGLPAERGYFNWLSFFEKDSSLLIEMEASNSLAGDDKDLFSLMIQL